MEHEEDRLSNLPKIILYDILSRLPEKDATRTSVLSKVWLDTWNTFPILSFRVTQIIGRPPQPTEKILRFCDYVTRRMLRFCNQSLTIKKFKLNLDMDNFGLRHVSKDIDIWLKLACESGIENYRNLIELKVTSPPPSIKNLDLHYVLVNESLFSSLVNIILSSCCPSTISFSLQCNRAFIEFFYETLMRRKSEDCFCGSSDTKCWWHDLKDVKVTYSMKIDENVDLKTMLDSLPTFETEGKISLMLEF